MKRRHLLMGAGLAIAAGLAAFGDKAPPADVAEPVARAARPEKRVAAPVAEAGKGAGPVVLRLVPREELIGDSADAFKPGETDLFGRQDWTPPPPPPPPAPPPPPPSAPPLPFTYIGKSVSDGAWEVYLARDERTYLVHEKEVIDATYRVDAIAPPTLTLTYLPLNKVQQINIGVFE